MNDIRARARPRAEKEKNRKHLLPCLAFVAAVLFYLFIHQYTERFRLSLWDETQGYLSEIAQQVTLIINDRMESNLKNLETEAMAISRMQAGEREEITAFLQTEATRYGYSGLSLAGWDGLALTNEGTVSNVSGRKHYLEALEGTSAISRLLTSDFDNTDAIEFAVPVWKNGKVSAVLLANYSLQDFQDIFSISIFEGQGAALVIDSFGVSILGSDGVDTYNFLTALKKNTSVTRESYQQLVRDIADGKSGGLSYTAQEERLLYYQPLDFNNWFLLISAPTEQISGKTGFLLKGLLYVGIFIAGLVSVLMLAIVETQRASRRKLEQLLYVDPVTEGISYAKFEQEAKKRVAEESGGYIIVQLNVERFKLINTSFGRERGNALLYFIYRSIAERLEPDELVARSSADRFCLLLRYRSQEEITLRIREITRQCNEFNIDSSQKKYILRFNAGACLVSGPKTDISLLYEQANFARTHGLAKQRLTGAVAFYSEVEQALILREKELENHMEEALLRGEFQIFLQPKYELQDNTISGAEALVRWFVPGKGMLPPNEFIPLFERNGFIVKLDLYVFDQVCRLLQRRWERQQRCVPISVNLSRRHLEDVAFLQAYQEIFAQYTFPARLLEIELTESIVFDNMHHLNRVIDQIHAIGFSCSMDDFGSGYSSLNLLKEIPVDTLKLDRAFFYSASGDMEKSHYVIETIIDLAGKLRMRTVSEGVETMEQVDYLRSVHCDMVQGFVFAKPQPVDQFERLMEEEPE